jgi:hypothetical protein
MVSCKTIKIENLYIFETSIGCIAWLASPKIEPVPLINQSALTPRAAASFPVWRDVSLSPVVFLIWKIEALACRPSSVWLFFGRMHGISQSFFECFHITQNIP